MTTTTDDEQQLIDTQAAATLTGLGRDTIRRYIRSGEIPVTRGPGRQWLINVGWLRQWATTYPDKVRERISAGGKAGYAAGLGSKQRATP